MKQKLTLLLIALVTSMGAWATDVTWESIHGWTQSSGGVGNFKWYGVHTPGDNTITYTMSSIQLKQCAGGDNNTNYLAIATVSPDNSSTIVEANVLAVSSNSIQATTSTLYEYTFTTPVTLTGGTTYYLVFVTANTPADNAYNIQTGRMEVNHVKYDQNFTYGPYSYGNSANNVDWWPYFTATLTTSAAITNYNYSCKNLAGYEFCSGTLPQASAPTKDQAPNLGDYYSCQSVSIDGTDVTFTYALTANPLASATTPAGDIATNPKYTTIESVAGQFVYYAEAGGDVKGDKNYSKDGNDAHWIIVGDEANGYKLYNANTGTSKVAVVADKSGEAIQMKDEASNTASLFDIRYIFGAYRLYKKGTKCCTNRLSSGTKLIGIHVNTNDGSNTVVTRYSKEITYKLKWNNEEIASESISVPTGDATSDHLPSEWERAYCNYTYDVSYVTTETSTVNVTIDWDGPFELSENFNTATWYYMNVGGYWISMNSTTKRTELNNSQVQNTNAIWAFKGNPYDGIKIMNLEAGDGYYVDFGNPATVSNTPSYELCYLKENGGNPYFLQENLFVSIVNGPVLSVAAAWTVNCNLTFDAVDFKSLSLDFIDEYASTHALGHYFGVSTSTYNSVRAGYADAASVSASNYSQLKSFIGAMLPAAYPETGYYRIKSNSGRYIGYGQPVADPMPSVGLRTVSAEDAARDASTIIRLTKGLSSHQYTMSTEGLNVQSMQSANTPFPANPDAGVTFVLTASTTAPGKGTIYNAASNDEGNGNVNGYLHEANWTTPGVVNWNATAASSQWEIEDAVGTELSISLNTVGSKSYATFSAPFPVTIGDGAKAYIIEELNLETSRAIYSEIESKQIPAGAGILLISETAASSVTATVSGTDFDELEDNILVGYNIAPTFSYPDETTDWNLVLGNSATTGIGFYQMSGTASPNKAYLPYPHVQGQDVKGFSLIFADDTIDGISSFEDGQLSEDVVIYNLSGQRLNKMQKGVNIINGKKIIVK